MALLGEGVAPGPRQLAVGEGQLAGFGERDKRGGAETEFAVATADDEPLDQHRVPDGCTKEVQPVAVSVASWRSGTDEGGRERLRAALVAELPVNTSYA